MTMTLDRSETDILSRLRLLAGRVSTDERAAPELRVLDAAADEIERLRDQLARIGQLASAARSVPLAPPPDGT
jgi:protein-arginine kinase